MASAVARTRHRLCSMTNAADAYRKAAEGERIQRLKGYRKRAERKGKKTRKDSPTLKVGCIVLDNDKGVPSLGVYFIDGGGTPTVLWEDGHSDPVDPETHLCTEIDWEVIPTPHVLDDEHFDAWMLHWHEIWQDGDGSVASERPNQAMLDLIKEIKERYGAG